jgi:hypothetical protein
VYAFVDHTVTIKNKTWTNPQVESHKKSHGVRLIRPQTQHINPEYIYFKVITSQTPSMKKIWVFMG